MNTIVPPSVETRASQLMQKQRAFFNSGKTKAVAFRKRQLKALKDAILKYESEIAQALYEDLHKCEFEAYGTETGFVLADLDYVLKYIDRWASVKRVSTPLFHFKSSSRIYPEPYGVTLIISPWNYPFQLLVSPLIGAIAAGNTAILKPSEHSPKVSGLVTKMVREIFDEEYVAVVEGGIQPTQELLAEQFDYIFFTGGTEVGRIIYQAAAKHLTPVTLELGGKSPCIVDKDIHLEYTARRIVWGKFINAGQTCIAPDYVLVHKDVKDKLLARIKEKMAEYYGEDPQKSKEYGRIINHRHFKRLCGLLDEEHIIAGGQVDEEDKYIAPTVMDNVNWDMPVMQEEIFGPILPILVYDKLEDAIATVNAHPKPLALYVFSNNSSKVEQVLKQTSSGGAAVNDTLVHIANPELPFGGVGASGMGAYHGKGSFETFSHYKSVLEKSNLFDVPVRYPPYKVSLDTLKFFFKTGM